MRLPETPLSQTQVVANKDLFQNIQGYCLVNHGRKNVWLALTSFEPQTDESRQRLRAQISACGAGTTTAFDLRESYAAYQSAKKAVASGSLANPKPGLVTAVGLSSRAYALLPPGSKPLNASFEAGFAAKFPQSMAEPPQPARYDAVIVVAGDDPGEVERQASALTAKFQGLATLAWQKGSIKKQADNLVHDHFGFPEGISQPVFFEDEPHRNDTWTSSWDPKASLEYVLFPQPGRAAETEYGSLMAFLRVRSNTVALDTIVAETRTATYKGPDDIKSWILGREMSGESLIPSTSRDRNDFDFSSKSESGKCPMAAHIRKMNPRVEYLRTHRILRRSASYEESGEKGTLFQCFQSNLESGFETLFRWAQDKNAPEPNGGADAVLSKRDFPPTPAGVRPVTAPLTHKSFVDVLGGEYFFFPSIPFFKRLAS